MPRITKKTKDGQLTANGLLYGGLTQKEYTWTMEYLKHGNATQAAIVAYPDTTYETQAQIGHENMRKAHIVDFIADYLAKNARPDDVMRELWKDVRDGNPQQRSRALELIAKIQGMVTERHLDVNKQKEELGEITYGSFAEADTEIAKA